MKKTVLLFGADGQVGWELQRAVAPFGEVKPLTQADVDLTDVDALRAAVREAKPGVILNAAAYTAVDKAEGEPEVARAVNAVAPAIMAEEAKALGAWLVHYSTDYVFDGAKKSPYRETDPAHPLNRYAAGKYAGEQAVLRASPQHLVLRTSWVFDWHPTQTKTFVHTVLRAVREGRPLRSTTDQVSVPTFATDLARWTLELIRRPAAGLFHAVNDEAVSRFEWTKIILEEAVGAGLIPAAPPVEPVLGSFFNSAMRRPDYTVMSNEKLARLLGCTLGSWRNGLRKMLAQMK